MPIGLSGSIKFSDINSVVLGVPSTTVVDLNNSTIRNYTSNPADDTPNSLIKLSDTRPASLGRLIYGPGTYTVVASSSTLKIPHFSAGGGGSAVTLVSSSAPDVNNRIAVDIGVSGGGSAGQYLIPVPANTVVSTATYFNAVSQYSNFINGIAYTGISCAVISGRTYTIVVGSNGNRGTVSAGTPGGDSYILDTVSGVYIAYLKGGAGGPIFASPIPIGTTSTTPGGILSSIKAPSMPVNLFDSYFTPMYNFLVASLPTVDGGVATHKYYIGYNDIHHPLNANTVYGGAGGLSNIFSSIPIRDFGYTPIGGSGDSVYWDYQTGFSITNATNNAMPGMFCGEFV